MGSEPNGGPGGRSGLEPVDRTGAEAALRESEEKYRRIVDATHDGIWMIDAESRTTFVNRRMAEMLGYGPDEMMGRPLFTFMTPEARVDAEQKIERRRCGISEEHDFRFQRKDGSELWTMMSAQPLLAADGAYLGAFATLTDITERKRVEEQREQYFKFFMLSTDPMCIADPFGCFRRVNPAFTRLTGFSEEELESKPFLDFVAPEDRERTASEMELQVGVRPSLHFENHYLCKDGSSVLLLWTAFFDRKDGVTYATAHDITERRRTEEALRRAGAYNRGLIEASVDPLVTIDQDGRILDVNEATVRATGVPRGEIVGSDFSDYFTDPEKARAGYLQVFREGIVRNYELELRHRGGGSTPVEYNATVYRGADGEALGVFAAARDIADRRRAEEAIRESEERFRKLSEELDLRVRERTAELTRSRQLLDETAHLSQVGGWDYDVRTGTLTWTDVTYEIHEVEPGTPLSVEVGIGFYAPESRPRIAEAFRRALAAGEPFDEELELVTAGGRRKWVRAIGNADREGGAVVRVHGVFQDVQSQKERLAALEDANRELEAYSYSVSHELRAPLRAIDGFSALLVRTYDGLLDDEGRRLLQRVRWNAQRMGQLIDDLLTFSQAGRAGLVAGTVDMVASARAAFAQVVPDPASRSRIAFELGDLPEAHGDPVLLRRVWENLVSNAVKFSAGRERPEIRIEGRTEGGETVYRIRDNGAGFDMRYADKLFGVFHRLHGVQEFEGTGVGLALVKRIVGKHGGRVRAEGAVGEGASFTFSLPAPPGP